MLSPAQAAELTWSVTVLLDELGLFTLEVFQKSREEIIVRQQREIAVRRRRPPRRAGNDAPNPNLVVTVALQTEAEDPMQAQRAERCTS